MSPKRITPALFALALGAVAPQTALSDTADGAFLYRWHCASCHGEDGKGDGYLAEHLTTTVPDLTALSRTNGGTFPKTEISDFITGSRDAGDLHGPADMPVWGPVFLMEAFTAVGTLTPEQLEQQEDYVADRIDALVDHLAKMQEASEQ